MNRAAINNCARHAHRRGMFGHPIIRAILQMNTQRTERLNCLSCVTQLVTGGARGQAQAVWFQAPTHHSAMCPLRADVLSYF